MFEAINSPYLVEFDEPFKLKDRATTPPASELNKKDFKKKLETSILKLDELQQTLFANQKYSVLFIFQAMDAAGKDGTIRAVMSGVNPAGCDVISFRQPTEHELDHDFLWRTTLCLPERGKIVIFNRSYYEEVLIVRVHPEFLEKQKMPWKIDLQNVWQERFESIVNHEKHLAENGTVIVKFFLHLSKGEQKKRFLSRIDEPDKNWKFTVSDVAERKYWDDYMNAYEKAIGATSRVDDIL